MEFSIKQARAYAGLTQAAMAKELGVDRGTYIKLEKDASRVTVGQAVRIAEFTGVPIESVLAALAAEVGGREAGS